VADPDNDDYGDLEEVAGWGGSWIYQGARGGVQAIWVR